MESTSTLNPLMARRSQALPAIRTLFRWLMSTLALRRPPAVDAVRQLCVDLLDDVPGVHRELLVQRLEKMRRVDDMPHLRGALFDVVSHFHGEAVARERIDVLDRGLKSFTSRGWLAFVRLQSSERRRRR
jgi:hypothetical protein